MRNPLIFVCAWLMLLFELSAAATDFSSSENATSDAMPRLLLQRLLHDANPTHNFLVAPHEIQTLLATLQQGGKIESSSSIDSDANSNVVESSSSSSYEQYFTAIAKPVIVSNTLSNVPQASNGAHDLELAAAAQSGHSELLNAVDISARWSINFQKRDTHKRQFYMPNDGHIYTEAMRKDDIFQYAHLEELNATALELPLQRNALKMLILLPDQANGLPQLAQQVCGNLSLLEHIVAHRLRPELVRIFIPKFRITYKTDVSEVFKEYGNLSMAFNKISKIAHQAHISVNERGIGDVERTTVLFWNAFSSMRTTPINFDIAHPFIFVIRNDQGIQFYGHLARL